MFPSMKKKKNKKKTSKDKKKTSKDKDVEPTEFEKSDAQKLIDLENTLHQPPPPPPPPTTATSSSPITGFALSFDEIKKRLECVYVYGIADSEQNFALIWNDDLADSRVNMYFSKKVAEKRLNKLKLNDPKMYADYEVSFYPLSDVLQLMMDDDESSFRLIPESEQMQHAKRKIMWRERVSPEIRAKVSWPDDITLPEVPVFKPKDFLVTINNTTYRPLYFRWEDLRKTKQVISGKKCTPSIELGDFMVTDFMAVIRRMMDDSNADWNNVMFISPGQDFVADEIK